MFIGESLTNIRILNDLSRSQLSDEIGITEQAIWQYENGYVSPKLEIVNKLKHIFKVKSSYFYNYDLLSNKENSILVEHIAYRSETINSLTKSQSESMYMRFLDAFLKKIEKKIDYPKNILLELREKSIKYLNDNPLVEKNVQIEKIAEIAREFIGLNCESNENLLFLLEKSGAFIFEKEIGETIDAYSLWSEDSRPYIILGSIKKSAVRRNFDLAHELGHLLLHYKVEFTMQDKKAYKKMEDEANDFASNFLLPKKQFEKDFESITKKSNPRAYEDLKLKWSVSLQALAIRAFKLKLIDYQQYRYFYMLINKNGFKKIEPLDNKIPIKKPMKVRSILQLLFENNLYTVSKLREELKVDLSFLTVLTGIEESFFEKYLEKENKIYSVSELSFKTL